MTLPKAVALNLRKVGLVTATIELAALLALHQTPLPWLAATAIAFFGLAIIGGRYRLFAWLVRGMRGAPPRGGSIGAVAASVVGLGLLLKVAVGLPHVVPIVSALTLATAFAKFRCQTLGCCRWQLGPAQDGPLIEAIAGLVLAGLGAAVWLFAGDGWVAACFVAAAAASRIVSLALQRRSFRDAGALAMLIAIPAAAL